MADLADEGYLSQPHTSAGRIPTEKAFRQYVRSLTATRMAVGGSGTAAQRVRRPAHGGGARGAVEPAADGVYAQCGDSGGAAGDLPGTGPDRAAAAFRRAGADDPGHARPHGAAPRGDARRAGRDGRIGVHPQLRQPQLRGLAPGRRAARAAAPHDGGPRAIRRRAAPPPAVVPEGPARRGRFPPKCTWKASRTCSAWTCT